MIPNSIGVRNVNHAYYLLAGMLQNKDNWIEVSPRGMKTLEWRGPFITEYYKPNEYVLFDPVRDANPFFHFMESIWILAGNADVKTLAKYNSQMVQFSDDGKVFHAPYGYRLRRHFETEFEDRSDGMLRSRYEPVDQILGVVNLLLEEPDTRRAVMVLWDPASDLSVAGWDRSNMDANVKDIPCNDVIFFKLREGHLNMTVCCRSNDALLGAYGANAVQFGVLLEFMAGAIGAKIGTYSQISDSFHVYTDSPQYKRMLSHVPGASYGDGIPYKSNESSFFEGDATDTQRAKMWLEEAETFMRGERHPLSYRFEFFRTVAIPIANAWDTYKESDKLASKNARIGMAQALLKNCAAPDWAAACHAWLARREENL